jgi:hypothetical protein
MISLGPEEAPISECRSVHPIVTGVSRYCRPGPSSADAPTPPRTLQETTSNLSHQTTRCLLQGNCILLTQAAKFSEILLERYSHPPREGTGIAPDQLKMTNSPPICKIAIVGSLQELLSMLALGHAAFTSSGFRHCARRAICNHSSYCERAALTPRAAGLHAAAPFACIAARRRGPFRRPRSLIPDASPQCSKTKTPMHHTVARAMKLRTTADDSPRR